MAEETPEQRKQRLRALREAQELLNSESQKPSPPTQQPPSPDTEDINGGEEETTENQKQDMRFRNYLPRDKDLQNNRVAPPVLPKFDDPVVAEPTVANGKEDPIVNIAPKKPNWDLHRAVEKKLEKLQKRTIKAMHELMQEQLQSARQDSDSPEDDMSTM